MSVPSNYITCWWECQCKELARNMWPGGVNNGENKLAWNVTTIYVLHPCFQGNYWPYRHLQLNVHVFIGWSGSSLHAAGTCCYILRSIIFSANQYCSVYNEKLHNLSIYFMYQSLFLFCQWVYLVYIFIIQRITFRCKI